MNYGLRKQAASYIEQLMQSEGKTLYSYNTIYKGLKWDSLTESYHFFAMDDTYSFSETDRAL